MAMKIKAIIYDFDNTLYSVQSLGNELFQPLFDLIGASGEYDEGMEAIKRDLMGKPFQVVAKEHHFSEDLTEQCAELLRNLTYKGEIRPFEDYEELKKIPGERYLVTTGFSDLQWSKIERMGIKADFKEIHVVDPDISSKTKKDVFADILQRKGYAVSEVWVVGDDPVSEIRAAQELGIETALLDKSGQHGEETASLIVGNFKELHQKLIALQF